MKRILAMLAAFVVISQASAIDLHRPQSNGNRVDQSCDIPAVIGRNAAILRELGFSFVDYQVYVAAMMDAHKEMQTFNTLFIKVGSVVFASNPSPIPELVGVQLKMSCKMFPYVYLSMD